MRFMILVKASKESEAGVMPQQQVFDAMATYHEDLAKAGVLLDAFGGTRMERSKCGNCSSWKTSSPTRRSSGSGNWSIGPGANRVQTGDRSASDESPPRRRVEAFGFRVVRQTAL